VEVGQGSITVVTDVAAVPGTVGRVLRAAGVHEVTTNDPRLDVTIHSDPHDATQKLVFVANPSAESVEGEISLDVGLKEVHELWDDRVVETSGTAIVESFAPYSIHVYRCTVTA
jgi:beta-galactosidase